MSINYAMWNFFNWSFFCFLFFAIIFVTQKRVLKFVFYDFEIQQDRQIFFVEVEMLMHALPGPSSSSKWKSSLALASLQIQKPQNILLVSWKMIFYIFFAEVSVVKTRWEIKALKSLVTEDEIDMEIEREDKVFGRGNYKLGF